MVAGRSHRNKALLNVLIVFIALLLVNIVANSFFHRFDLTKEKRFTLSESTERLLDRLDDIVYAKVYLNGDLPPDFKRLRNSTRDMLLELEAKSQGMVQFEFIDPQASENSDEQKQMFDQLVEKGLRPINLQVVEEGEYKESIRFPGASPSSHASANSSGQGGRPPSSRHRHRIPPSIEEPERAGTA